MNMLTGRHPCLAQLLTHDHCLHVEQAYSCLEVTHLVRAQLREGGGHSFLRRVGAIRTSAKFTRGSRESNFSVILFLRKPIV